MKTRAPAASRATAESRSRARPRARASDAARRVAALEDALQDLQRAISLQRRWITALQAQLDHVAAKQRG